MNSKYQTLAEIEAAYPDQWVLIDSPTADRFGEVTGGRIAAHTAERSAFDRLLMETRLSDSAILYTGELNPDPITVYARYASI